MGEGISPLQIIFMFDAITPHEPEDMFENTDQSVTPSVAPPTSSPLTSSPAPSPVTSPPISSGPRMSTGKIALFIVGAVVIVAAAGFISYYVLSARESVVSVIVTQDPVQPIKESVTGGGPVVEEEPIVVDTDKDGLTDEEEETLGTSPRSSDTDRDELYDYEEVNVYHTNPLSKDSDDDGYEDGVEIAGGYDPNGLGKLLELPSVE